MEKIWLKSYPKNVPAEINPDAYESLVDVFEQSSEKYANLKAYTNFNTSLTFKELDEKAKIFAAFLQKQCAAKPGEKLALILPNVLQYPVCLFGGLRAGLTIVNVNPLYTPRELAFQLIDAEVTHVVVMENFAHTLQEILSQTKVRTVIITKLGDLFPPVKRILANILVKYVKGLVPFWEMPNVYWLHHVLKKSDLLFEPVKIQREDIAFLQYTGGTTGISKGAMLTHRNLIANLEQATAWISSAIQGGEEVVITALPLYHIFSLLANCLLFIKMGGENVLITNPRDIKNFIKELKKLKKFTVITGVNTLFNALLNDPAFADLNFSKFKLALGGGMAVQKPIAEKWEKITGHPLLEAYGLTETSPAVTINPLSEQHYNESIGLPIPSTEISFRDDKGNEVQLGEVGELCIRGPQVMKGYWKQPEETRQMFYPDGFLKSGDMGYMDKEGYVYLRERKKDMINISGFNVYPSEIESVIAAHPGVTEVAVIGLPSKVVGEKIKAFIIRKDPLLTKEEIIEFCKQQLTAYKIPREIEFRDNLPKSNVGKILRSALREEG